MNETHPVVPTDPLFASPYTGNPGLDFLMQGFINNASLFFVMITLHVHPFPIFMHSGSVGGHPTLQRMDHKAIRTKTRQVSED